MFVTKVRCVVGLLMACCGIIWSAVDAINVDEGQLKVARCRAECLTKENIQAVESPTPSTSTVEMESTISTTIASKTSAEEKSLVPDDLGNLEHGPCQRKLSTYPKGHKNRSFRSIWYESFKWLEYSVKKDKAFCFACRNFSTGTSKSESAFTEIGWCTWGKAMETGRGLRKHDSSSDHLFAMTRWECYQAQKDNIGTSIRNVLDPDRVTVVSNNREFLKMLIQYHQYFCAEEMAYRGHDETDESVNAGKWKEFIGLMLSTNPRFKQLHDNIRRKYKVYDYTSKRSSNELIKAMAIEVRQQIRNMVDNAGMYSMLIDECKDNAGHEELAICLRFVNSANVIEERFYDLIRMKSTNAAAILQEGISPSFDKMDTSACILALGADGASVMSGCYEGVAAKLKKQYPWLIYVHCAAHRLNLIVSTYLSKVKEAKNVINAYKSLQSIFNVAKNRELFEETQKEQYPNEAIMAASSLTEVRWSCKFDGVNTMIRRLKAILISLRNIASSNSNQADLAAALYHKILSGKFLISLSLLHRILAVMNGLSKVMQESSIKWITVAGEMLAVRMLLTNINVETILEDAASLCCSVGISIDYEDPIHTLRAADHISVQDNFGFCKTLITATIPLILEELDKRFSDTNIEVLGAMDALDASKKSYLHYSTMLPLISRFAKCLEIDTGLLKTELQRANILISEGKSIDFEIYGNLRQAITVSKTLPISTATVERSFSAMNRILTWSRNSLDSAMASDFMVLSMNKDILKSVDLDCVLDRWAHQKKRVMQFS